MRIALSDERDGAPRTACKLVPGMPVEAFIQTGERTMLSYFTKPLTDQAARSFKGRCADHPAGSAARTEFGFACGNAHR